MTIKAAKKLMLNFMDKYRGKTVRFMSLTSDEDKLGFVLIKSFQYFDFLPKYDRIVRAMNNAEAQAKNNFKAWGYKDALAIPKD